MNDVIKTAIIYRGTVLQEMALMELMLNQYLAEYFCGKDQEKISSMHILILGDERITLSNKIQIFNALTTSHDIIWVNTYISKRKGDGKKIYNLNQDLNYVVEQRNIFAHRILDGGGLDTIHPKHPNTIRFMKMKNEITPLDYSQQLFELILEVIIDIREFLAKKIMS
jgi:hypothetical protein